MYQYTGNKAWLTGKEGYHCEIGLAKEMESCADNCVRGKVVDGACTDPNVFGNLVNPTDLYQIESVDHKVPNDCNQCAENCWNPSIGSKLIEMLSLLDHHKDDIWFAHFVEIVQYLWNRKYTRLDYLGMIGNTAKLTLTSTNSMKKWPITVSFSTSRPSCVKVDGEEMTVHKSTTGTKWYIKFQPKDNHVHKIECCF